MWDIPSSALTWLVGISPNFNRRYELSFILRKFQQTPGAYPRHPQDHPPKWKEFLHEPLVINCLFWVCSSGIVCKILRNFRGLGIFPLSFRNVFEGWTSPGWMGLPTWMNFCSRGGRSEFLPMACMKCLFFCWGKQCPNSKGSVCVVRCPGLAARNKD